MSTDEFNSAQMIAADVNGDGVADYVYAEDADVEGRILYVAGNRSTVLSPGESILPKAGFQTGFAVGDIDGDGDVDLVVGSPPVVVKNDGAGHFGAAVENVGLADGASMLQLVDMDGDGALDVVFYDTVSPGGAVVWKKNVGGTGTAWGPASAPLLELDFALPQFSNNPRFVVADFDGDGIMDVAGTNTSMLTSYLTISTSTGGVSTIVLSSSAYNLMSADLNGDGNADLVLQVYSVIYLFLADGSGGMFAPTTLASSTFYEGAAMVAGDVDSDGDLDLATYASNTAKVWVNSGTGTFSDASPPSTAFSAFVDFGRVALADVDGDGNDDIMGVLMRDNLDGPGFAWAQSNGAGLFPTSTTVDFPSFKTTTGLAMGDMDGDGRNDLVRASTNTGRVYWRRSLSDGQVASGLELFQNFGASGSAWMVVDLNNDGVSDVVFARQSRLEVAYNDGAGHSLGPVVVGPGSFDVVVAADMNGDGVLDLVTGAGSGGPDELTVFLMGLAGPASSVSSLSGIDTDSLATGDLDGDGNMDVVYVESNIVRWVAGGGDGTLSSPQVLATTAYFAPGVLVADVEDDGDVDVLFFSDFTTLQLLTNDGTGLFGTPTEIEGKSAAPVSGRSSLAVADFNGDTVPDLLGDTRLELHFGLPGGAGLSPRAMISWDMLARGRGPFVVGDMLGTGSLDVVQDTANGVFTYSKGSSDWAYSSSGTTVAASSMTPSGGVDVNGDGVTDLVGADTAGPTPLVWIDGATGAESVITSTLNGLALNPFAFGDVNADGVVDVVAVFRSSSNADSYPVLFLGDGTSFGAPTQVSTVDVNSVHLVDVNGDGHLDLVSVAIGGALEWIANDGTGGFTAPAVTIASATNDIYDVFPGAFNRDGRVDFFFRDTSSFFGEVALQVAVNQGDGSAWVVETVANVVVGNDLVVCDVDSNGLSDVVYDKSGSTFAELWVATASSSGVFVNDVQRISTSVTRLSVIDLEDNNYPTIVMVDNGGDVFWSKGDSPQVEFELLFPDSLNMFAALSAPVVLPQGTGLLFLQSQVTFGVYNQNFVGMQCEPSPALPSPPPPPGGGGNLPSPPPPASSLSPPPPPPGTTTGSAAIGTSEKKEEESTFSTTNIIIASSAFVALVLVVVVVVAVVVVVKKRSKKSSGGGGGGGGGVGMVVI